MVDVVKLFSFLGIVFLLMALVFNLVPKLPKIPGDIFIDRPNIKIYIPFASALIISALLTLYFNFFKK